MRGLFLINLILVQRFRRSTFPLSRVRLNLILTQLSQVHPVACVLTIIALLKHARLVPALSVVAFSVEVDLIITPIIVHPRLVPHLGGLLVSLVGENTTESVGITRWTRTERGKGEEVAGVLKVLTVELLGHGRGRSL